MSVVTGIVICFSCMEDYKEHEDGVDTYPIIDAMNTWLGANGKLPLVQLDEHMCRVKHPQMNVFGGGYNFLDNDGFIDLFKNSKWIEPEEVYMIVNPENDPMHVVRPNNLNNQ